MVINMALDDKEIEKPDDIDGSPKDISKKSKSVSKKKGKTKKPKKKKTRKLMNLPEPSQQVLRAAGGGLLGVLSVVALTYILWGIITDNSILYAGSMIDMLSMGNGFNALMGVWALAFTPLTSLNSINKFWMDNFIYTLIPVLVAGVTIGITTKRIATAILGGIFFIFWGIIIPVLFVYVFSVFGVCDPAIVDSILVGILNKPLDNWNYDWLFPLFGNNIFIAWSVAGSIELGLIAIIIAIPIGAILQLITK